MSYRWIEGELVLGYGREGDMRSSQPDGDSIWLRANDADEWRGIGDRTPRLSKGNTVPLLR